MEYQLTEAEFKLAEIIWQQEPIDSPELVKLCEAQLQWKKSTTYTMLKRLEKKRVFENRGGTVEAVLTREEFDAERSGQFVAESFGGSLPKFLTAFTRDKRLSKQEIEELQKLIAEYEEG